MHLLLPRAPLGCISQHHGLSRDLCSLGSRFTVNKAVQLETHYLHSVGPEEKAGSVDFQGLASILLTPGVISLVHVTWQLWLEVQTGEWILRLREGSMGSCGPKGW